MERNVGGRDELNNQIAIQPSNQIHPDQPDQPDQLKQPGQLNNQINQNNQNNQNNQTNPDQPDITLTSINNLVSNI